MNTSTSDSEDEDEDESVRREEGGLEKAQAPLSHVQPSEFSMEHQSSPGEGGSPLEGNTDRPATGGLEQGEGKVVKKCNKNSNIELDE